MRNRYFHEAVVVLIINDALNLIVAAYVTEALKHKLRNQNHSFLSKTENQNMQTMQLAFMFPTFFFLPFVS